MSDIVASTANGPMVLVALEQLMEPHHRIITDPYAANMLPFNMRMVVKAGRFRPVRQQLFKFMDQQMPNLRLGFLCRKRYMDVTVADILSANADIESLVILGAGLDTLAYRNDNLSHVRVYEVDMPINIDHKRKRLQATFGQVPDHVTLVPINFEHQPLDGVLAQHGYSFSQKSIFVWEAVTQYLTEDAVRNTLRVLEQAQAGSHLIFTYVIKEFIDGTHIHGLDYLYQEFRVKNQYWHFGLDPDGVAGFIWAYGWRVVEQVAEEDFAARCLQPVGREGTITGLERIVHARKTG